MDDDDFDPIDVGYADLGEDVSLVTVQRPDGSTAAALLPRSISRLDPDQAELVSSIQHVAVEIHRLQGELSDLVADARSMGVSWGAIGWSTGMAAQSARGRWGGPENAD